MGTGRARMLTTTLGALLGRESVHFLQRHLPGETPPRDQSDRARAIREALEELGPLYIKVGQMLSTRPDLVSQPIIEELGRLHDRVTATPFAEFEPVLAAELGPLWRTRFLDIDTSHPLGAASLAQVYRATLTDGTPVALKVQRPGIQAKMAADMALLRRMTRVIGRQAPRFSAVVDTTAMLDVVFDAMRSEIDFTLEARNMRAATKTTAEFKYLTVPTPLIATPRVLAQTLAPGRSIRDADPADFTLEERTGIGRDLLAYMYRSYFLHRTFHADPHPGNILVHPGEPAHLIDWGMVGHIDRSMSHRMILVLLSLARNDAHATAKAWMELGHATPWANVSNFTIDLASLVPKIANASLEELNLGVTLTSLLAYSTRRGIKTNPMISILGKSFANIEGSIRNLCPELSLIDVFETELRHILFRIAGESLSEGQAAHTVMQAIVASDDAPQQIRNLLRDITNRELSIQLKVSDLPLRINRGNLPLLYKIARAALGAAALRALWRLGRTPTEARK
ncbi:ABC1 kinase family protein [Streptomyces minutiscleroticus]|uniref:ABC1 kinase family protein n=1 Tax=Streptomyces minutiscleroticus TaxID=68238 RepID=UPI00332C5280